MLGTVKLSQFSGRIGICEQSLVSSMAQFGKLVDKLCVIDRLQYVGMNNYYLITSTGILSVLVIDGWGLNTPNKMVQCQSGNKCTVHSTTSTWKQISKPQKFFKLQLISNSLAPPMVLVA